VLGSWHVPSYFAVRQGVLKPSRDALSEEPPHGRVGLFTPGCLAFSPSSLGCLPEYFPSLPRPSLSLGLCAS
jgi:hypothetical protein